MDLPKLNYYLALESILRVQHGIHAEFAPGDMPGEEVHLRVTVAGTHIEFYHTTVNSLEPTYYCVQHVVAEDGDYIEGEVYTTEPQLYTLAADFEAFYKAALVRQTERRPDPLT
jgi:hypothetical protein